MLRRDYTLYQDTREKRPLLFPKVLPMLSGWDGSTTTVRLHVVQHKLQTGDYCLAGYEHVMLIERKGSITELAKNLLTSDRARVRRSFERLRDECQFPVLLLEGTMSSLLKSRYVEKPYRALDALMRLCAEYGIQFLQLSNLTTKMRTSIGEQVARLLVNYAYTWERHQQNLRGPQGLLKQMVASQLGGPSQEEDNQVLDTIQPSE